MKYTRPRGTRDITPAEIERWERVEHAFEQAFKRYCYRGIRTPIIESTDLFIRAVGEQSDIVTKEMYTFKDQGDRSITLRPENTAGVIRAYLENGMHRLGGIQRLWYMGPMFRYDRPQTGRYRQFHQVGAEAIGSASPALDAEIIALVVEVLTTLGFQNLDVRVNSVGTEESRVRYRLILRNQINSIEQIAPKDRERYQQNPLRIFDSKDYGSRLRHLLPPISEFLIDEDRSHFQSVKDLLTAVSVPFTVDPYLVRGLDYYTRTVFEIYHGERASQNALCGGGRYDTLVAECGGPDTPAIGMSVGLERIVEALGVDRANEDDAAPFFYVMCVGLGEAEVRGLKAARVLREIGSAELDVSGRSQKTQLEAARKKKARFAVLVDASSSDLIWHDLSSRSQNSIGFDELVKYARNAQVGEIEETGS